VVQSRWVHQEEDGSAACWLHIRVWSVVCVYHYVCGGVGLSSVQARTTCAMRVDASSLFHVHTTAWDQHPLWLLAAAARS
jgi:hypothetical protein